MLWFRSKACIIILTCEGEPIMDGWRGRSRWTTCSNKLWASYVATKKMIRTPPVTMQRLSQV